MTLRHKFKRFFELGDDYAEEEVEVEEYEKEYEDEASFTSRETGPTNDRRNVVSLSSIQHQAKVMLLEPHSYEEAQEIADHLKNRKAVVINLQRISREQAKRIVDFLSGTVYAIGGDIQKLGANIFLCTPENVDVSGSISEMFAE
ncbi:cell division protein SepF [Salipaludibacillus sp. LMS25]|jgi:cell division inhibitor SepF|uniref:cell division protein SepF n=1 Tax=Salipaludibacillus sp. LMS25 TaxID=2924031 RepID=UPI0020D08158|nr:cell division protein SepF [Salipaludibacillus sp. LMS25]UTR15174.1 cell division protein SepF [Salipaludibacillus sp. LMS25]